MIALAGLLGAVIAGISVGPAGMPFGKVMLALIDRLPAIHVRSGLSPIDDAILWQIRAPRVVLGGLVGAMLASAGASYQGAFRNPLADPYLLGVAAGAGLGATIVVATVADPASWPIDPVPLAAFAGGLVAAAATYVLGRSARRRNAGTLILAGVAVAAIGSGLAGLGVGALAPVVALAAVLLYAGFVAPSSLPAPRPHEHPGHRQRKRRLDERAGDPTVR
jgi:iron complex transport system permease protein